MMFMSRSYRVVAVAALSLAALAPSRVARAQDACYFAYPTCDTLGECPQWCPAGDSWELSGYEASDDQIDPT